MDIKVSVIIVKNDEQGSLSRSKEDDKRHEGTSMLAYHLSLNASEYDRDVLFDLKKFISENIEERDENEEEQKKDSNYLSIIHIYDIENNELTTAEEVLLYLKKCEKEDKDSSLKCYVYQDKADFLAKYPRMHNETSSLSEYAASQNRVESSQATNHENLNEITKSTNEHANNNEEGTHATESTTAESFNNINISATGSNIAATTTGNVNNHNQVSDVSRLWAHDLLRSIDADADLHKRFAPALATVRENDKALKQKKWYISDALSEIIQENPSSTSKILGILSQGIISYEKEADDAANALLSLSKMVKQCPDLIPLLPVLTERLTKKISQTSQPQPSSAQQRQKQHHHPPVYPPDRMQQQYQRRVEGSGGIRNQYSDDDDDDYDDDDEIGDNEYIAAHGGMDRRQAHGYDSADDDEMYSTFGHGGRHIMGRTNDESGMPSGIVRSQAVGSDIPSAADPFAGLNRERVMNTNMLQNEKQYEVEMGMLIDQGFTDVEKNLALLRRYYGNISMAVNALIEDSEGGIQ